MDKLKELLKNVIDDNVLQIVISSKRNQAEIVKIKMRPLVVKDKLMYQITEYIGTQVLHKNIELEEISRYIIKSLEEDFKQMQIQTITNQYNVLVSKKGKCTISNKKNEQVMEKSDLSHNRNKQYLIKEGKKVEFLVDLGVMTQEGKIANSKYDKYKQINRFLEFIEDILPAFEKSKKLKILDFGCGKSYLTFAMYYFLHEIRGYDVQITGLDLKESVINSCNDLRDKYGYKNLQFIKGDISDYNEVDQVDMVVTLHACDTATDYAIAKAISWNASVILSVPCCQHEINSQIHNDLLKPTLKYGVIKERISALLTDAIRADLLEISGYSTQILEFIDMEHTAKNLLIRAVKNDRMRNSEQDKATGDLNTLIQELNISPSLDRLLDKKWGSK